MRFRLLVTLALPLMAAGCTFPTYEGAHNAEVGALAPATLTQRSVIQHRMADLEQKNQTYLKAAQDAASENARMRVTLKEQDVQIEGLRELSSGGTGMGTVISADTPAFITTQESGVAVVEEPTGDFSTGATGLSAATEPATGPSAFGMDETETGNGFEPATPATLYTMDATPAAAPSFGETSAFTEASPADVSESPFATTPEAGAAAAPATQENIFAPEAASAAMEAPASPFAESAIPAATPIAPGAPFAPVAPPAAEVTPAAIAPSDATATGLTEPVPTPVNPFAAAAVPETAPVAPAATTEMGATAPVTSTAPAITPEAVAPIMPPPPGITPAVTPLAVTPASPFAPAPPVTTPAVSPTPGAIVPGGALPTPPPVVIPVPPTPTPAL